MVRTIAIAGIVGCVLLVASAFSMPMEGDSSTPTTAVEVIALSTDPGSATSADLACNKWCVESNLVGIDGTMCIEETEEPEDYESGPFEDCDNEFPDESWCMTWVGSYPCIGCDPQEPVCGEDEDDVPVLLPSGLAYVNDAGSVEFDAESGSFRKTCNQWVVKLAEPSEASDAGHVVEL